MGKKIGELLGLEWLAERLPSSVTGRPKLTIQVQDGLTFINDGVRSIVTVHPNRRRLYKRGIDARLQRVAAGYNVPQGWLRPGDVVLNVGANIGEIALWASALGARVIAIEPDPLTLRCLRLNTSETDVSIVPTGAWKADGPVTFYQAPATADTSAINKSDLPITIEASRIDTIVKDTPGRIRLIIGDAEGAEPEVLQGATETLARTDCVAIAANNERNGESTTEAVVAILTSTGMHIRNVDKYGYVLAVQGSV